MLEWNMTTARLRSRIAASPEEVFDFYTDPDRRAEWNPSHRGIIEQVGPLNEAGSHYVVETRFGRFEVELLRVERPRLIEMREGLAGSQKVDVRMLVEPTATGRTYMTVTSTYPQVGMRGLLAALFGRAYGRLELRRFKAAVERAAAGRTGGRDPPPFAPLLAGFSNALPPAFAHQFLQSTPVRLEGVMHEIWHRPILGPLFRLLGALGILVGKAGHGIPTTVVIERAALGQCYRREFRFDPPVQFSSLNAYDRQSDRVVEWVGPGKSLGMAWDVRFQPPATLLLATSGWLIRLGQVKLPIPGWLWPWVLGRADTIQHADEEQADTVHIDLVIRHALFGEIFGFSGTFRVHVSTT